MSYDLAIWHESQKTTPEKALKTYLSICGGEGQPAPNPAVAAFIAELVGKYPQIDDVDEDELDDCPWTNEFDTSAGHCILNIRWGFEEVVEPLVVALAQKHGLLCFDPQSGAILTG